MVSASTTGVEAAQCARCVATMVNSSWSSVGRFGVAQINSPLSASTQCRMVRMPGDAAYTRPSSTTGRGYQASAIGRRHAKVPSTGPRSSVAAVCCGSPPYTGQSRGAGSASGLFSPDGTDTGGFSVSSWYRPSSRRNSSSMAANSRPRSPLSLAFVYLSCTGPHEMVSEPCRCRK